jgi:hypothetical protein
MLGFWKRFWSVWRVGVWVMHRIQIPISPNWDLGCAFGDLNPDPRNFMVKFRFFIATLSHIPGASG